MAFLSEYPNERYLLVQVLFNDFVIGKESTGPGHIGCLIFDQMQHRIYCFDSNGSTDTYADNNSENGIRDSLDFILADYFANTYYEYVPNHVLTNGKQLNKRHYLADDRGTCLPWTILFGLFLRISEFDNPIELYRELSELSQNERGALIYNFIENLMHNRSPMD
jgi:hypothetical protein